ncbi:MAG TPA: helix-turn-helix domain-containing protein [Clostridia bacterium]|nr:helix-turn-helix domain-containing protein [Clostridia bacterium]
MLAKGENTKSRILEAAAELFTNKGFSGVTMKDVCEATGLSRGGLYRYFSSTEEMMMELMEQEQLRADRMAGNIPMSSRSASELLEEFMSTHESYLTSRKAKLEIAMNQFALTSEAGREANNRRLSSAVKRLESVILKGQRDGLFRPGSASDMAYHVLVFMGGMRTQVCLGDYGGDFVSRQLEFIKSYIYK